MLSEDLVRIALVVATAAGILSCTIGSIAPTSLQTPVTKSDIQIAERLSYKQKITLGPMMEYGLQPGKYTAEKQNSKGVFYRGEGRPVWSKNLESEGGLTVFQGGIWVPKNTTESPRLYTYLETKITTIDDLESYTNQYQEQQFTAGNSGMSTVAGTAAAGAIAMALIAFDDGRITIWNDPEDSTFRSVVAMSIRTAK